MELQLSSALRTGWRAINRPSVKYSFLAIAAAFFVVGAVFVVGFGSALEATNKLEFCIGCHEMEATVYQEYKTTIHYGNRTGVRATCPDCHVPKDFAGKMLRKVKAVGELWGKVTGSIDTKEKFDARRMQLATNEWARMKARDSQECRNCHDFDAMSPAKQKQTPYKKHMEGKAAGKSCIDCHKGIAHELPAGYEEPDEG